MLTVSQDIEFVELSLRNVVVHEPGLLTLVEIGSCSALM
jgi:hypothetical protein